MARCRAKQVTARRGQAGVRRARRDEPGWWARAGYRGSPFPACAAAARHGRPRTPRTRAWSAVPSPSAADPVPPAPSPRRLFALHFTTTGGNEPGSAAGGGNGETLAALLPPAGLGLIQFNREIVSPKPNNLPENPRPGATGRILGCLGAPTLFPARTWCGGRPTPVAQPGAGVAR